MKILNIVLAIILLSNGSIAFADWFGFKESPRKLNDKEKTRVMTATCACQQVSTIAMWPSSPSLAQYIAKVRVTTGKMSDSLKKTYFEDIGIQCGQGPTQAQFADYRKFCTKLYKQFGTDQALKDEGDAL